ncbi:MAG: hypothetical protein ACXVRA_09515 [Gaiellaceae bacterium]
MSERRGTKRLALTAEQAARRVEELRRVFDQGFLSKDRFEGMQRDIKDRVKVTRRKSRPAKSGSA